LCYKKHQNRSFYTNLWRFEKIVKALASIDADVFGLVEVQQGQLALEKLANALNEIDPSAQYTYINDGTQVYGTFTKAGYLYKASKVKPLRQLQSNNTGVKHRKKAQGFEVLATGEKFVYMINHFKAKSGKGSGDNADTEDGQGAYNGDRVREATAVVTFAKSCATYFDDEDVLIMGDLNAYSMEDPIRKFTDVGYVHLIKQFAKDEGYSYIYKGMVGCLDYALANEQMAEQVTGCEVFHINADEAAVFGYNGYSYQDNMYRSSDHDPVVVGLRLGTNTPTESIKTDDRIIYGGEGVIGVASAEDCEMEIYTLMGQKVYAEKIMSNEYTVSTAEIGLKGGIYIVKLSDGDVVKLRIL
jgi:predicted extracellular nuclease